jgi:periplasmic protein TonB
LPSSVLKENLEFRVSRVGIAAGLVLAHAVMLFALFTIARRPAVQPTPASIVSFISTAPKAEEWRPQTVEVATTEISIPVPAEPAIDSPPPAPPAAEAITPPAESSEPAAAAVESANPERKVVTSVVYIREPVLRYPPQSWRLREQGVVLFEVLVDEQGIPAQIKVERTSGYPRLDEAGRQAVLQARFRPYAENGVARSVYVLVPIRFNLKRR